LDAAIASEDPYETRPDSIDQEQPPAYDTQKDVQGSNTRPVVYQCYAKSKKDPADDVVSNASSENCNSDGCGEKFQFCEYPAKNRKRSDL
jgi:hypothetical protein